MLDLTLWLPSVLSCHPLTHTHTHAHSHPAADHPTKFEFENGIVGNAIPPNFIPACEKGFREAVNAGQLIGHPVEASPAAHPCLFGLTVCQNRSEPATQTLQWAPCRGLWDAGRSSGGDRPPGALLCCHLACPLPAARQRDHPAAWTGAHQVRTGCALRRNPAGPNPAAPLPLCCAPQGVRVVLTDGAAHAVDSSELAFKLASLFAFK